MWGQCTWQTNAKSNIYPVVFHSMQINHFQIEILLSIMLTYQKDKINQSSPSKPVYFKEPKTCEKKIAILISQGLCLLFNTVYVHFSVGFVIYHLFYIKPKVCKHSCLWNFHCSCPNQTLHNCFSSVFLSILSGKCHKQCELTQHFTIWKQSLIINYEINSIQKRHNQCHKT